MLSAQNTINTEAIDQAVSFWNAPRIGEFKLHNNINKNTNYLLFCGRLTSKSGVELLLYALKEPSLENSNIKVIILGEGPEKKDFEELTRKLKLSEKVLWIEGSYDEKILAPWFLVSSLFLYPGAVGLSLIHGMAYGLPVITHEDKLHQNPEFSLLRSGFNGLTFKKGCSCSLADTISSTLDNKNELYETRMPEKLLKKIIR